MEVWINEIKSGTSAKSALSMIFLARNTLEEYYWDWLIASQFGLIKQSPLRKTVNWGKHENFMNGHLVILLMLLMNLVI